MDGARKPPGRLIGPIFEPPKVLAPCATKAAESRGRFYEEPESGTRTCFQRDRDRIIHSSAFRRLKHKTQVFVHHEGDYYRTRLTHSLEVAQIARSLARVLALDEDLTEAIALAHDLGHTPFGHAGEEALDEATQALGGFDHNAHALRLVTQLEHRYAGFDGLNLTWECLEGLVKHNGPLAGQQVPEPIAAFDRCWSLELENWPGLEAQVAALADDIAYVNHDIDDGLRAGLFQIDDLRDAPLIGQHVRSVQARSGALELSRFIGEIVRGLISELVENLLHQTRKNLTTAKLGSLQAVRAAGNPAVQFGSAKASEIGALKAFLFAGMYRHPTVTRAMDRARRVVLDLYSVFAANPLMLPPDWAAACGSPNDSQTGVVIRDYIAGMTDRFALQEHSRITYTENLL